MIKVTGKTKYKNTTTIYEGQKSLSPLQQASVQHQGGGPVVWPGGPDGLQGLGALQDWQQAFL